MKMPYDAGFALGSLVFYTLSDDNTVIMLDPAEGAVLIKMKYTWGENINRWKEENRIKREIKEAEEERKRKEREEKEKEKQEKED